MAYVNGYIYLGTPYQKSRTRGVTIAEKYSRVQPRYAPNPPQGPPYNVAASTAAESQCINLSWLNGTVAPAETEIWESANGSDFTPLVLTGVLADGLVPLTQLSYKRNTGVFDTVRYYQLRHMNSADYSGFSAIVSARSQKDLPGSAPSNLVVAQVTARPSGETRLSLSFATGDSTAQTRVYRRLSPNGTYALITTLALGVNTYTDTGLTALTSYDYYVVHLKSGVTTAQSNTGTQTTLSDGPDAAPSNVTGVARARPAGETIFDVAWLNGDASCSTELWARLAGSGAYALFATANPGVTTQVVTGGVAGESYEVYARHLKSGVNSANSNVASVTMLVDGPDAAPSNLAVSTPTARPLGETELDLTWTNGDTSCQTRVYRDGSLVGTASAGATSYNDTGLSAHSDHSYVVVHIKNAVLSANSNTFSGTTLVDGPNADPTNLAVGNPGGGIAALTWTNGDSTASTEVYRGATLVATVGAGVALYNDNLGGGQTALYKVRHTKNAVPSGYSNTVSVSTLSGPGVPTNLSVGVDMTSLYALNGDFIPVWVNVDGAAQIIVTRNGVDVATLTPGTTSWRDTNSGSHFSQNVSAAYHVRHRRNGFDSGVSADVAAVIPNVPDAPPYNLTATNAGAGIAALVWVNGDATCETQILRNGSVIDTVGAGVTTYNYYQSAGSYTYTVRHTKSGYPSAPSNSAGVTTGPAPAGAPVLNSVTGGDRTFSLAWSNADNYSLIELYRSYGGAYEYIGVLAAGTTAYLSTGYSENTVSYWYLRHRYDGFYSGNSTVLGAWNFDKPDAAPYNLNASGVGYSGATLNWTNGDASCLSDVYYYNGGWVYLGRVGAGGTSIGIGGLVPDTAYTWLVRHVKTDNTGSTWTLDSSNASFTTAHTPAPGMSMSHAGDGGNGAGGIMNVNVNPSVGGVSAVQAQIARLSDGYTYYDSGAVSSINGTIGSYSMVAPNTATRMYARQMYAGVWSPWATVDVTTPPGPEAAPSVVYNSSASGFANYTFTSNVSAKSETILRYFFSGARGEHGTTNRTWDNGDPVAVADAITVAGQYAAYGANHRNGYYTSLSAAGFIFGPAGPPTNLVGHDVSTGSSGAGNVLYTVGLTWSNADSYSSTEIWIDGSPWTGGGTVPGATSASVSFSSYGSHTFQLRHTAGGAYSSFSNVITVVVKFR